jgi:hypothetical protein
MVLVLAFGSPNDPQAWELSDILQKALPSVDFVKTSDPMDVMSSMCDFVLDVAPGLKSAKLLSVDDIRKRDLFTAHDFDLGFFMKMTDTAGLRRNVRIIGIPENWGKKTLREVAELLSGGARQI